MSETVRKQHCAVQSKISCILKTVVRGTASSKRPGQNYFIEATNDLSHEALTYDFKAVLATEKLDGTCCHIRKHNGRPVLWARLDRKPNKGAEKRFKAFQRKHREWELAKNGDEPEFVWKFPDDLKTVPDHWIPADDVANDTETDCPTPDKNGHIPGWVPVDQTSPQYCWHSSVVDYDINIALTLKPSGLSVDSCNELMLLISPTSLNELEGKTLELVGTNINGNPYGLGRKPHPFHVLVEHGCIPALNIPESLTAESLHDWFTTNENSKIEGIVWHLSDGKMFKLHRHHLKLPWPLSKDSTDLSCLPHLSHRPVTFSMKDFPVENYSPKSMFSTVSLLNCRTFQKFSDVFDGAANK